jgi:hypothetical protein
MDEFEIPIVYQGINREVKAKVLHLGYTYKIQVDVDDVTVVFEPDESRLFRAVLVDAENEVKSIDKKLIETIAQTLDALLGAN